MDIRQQRMKIIFNEWAERYAQNPDSFDSILNEDGTASKDYGEKCVACFDRIAEELDEAGKLPKPE